jgi:uracil-DNA glycosylase
VRDPGRDCPACPRLVAFREEWRRREPAWFNAPVPSFGAPDARLVVVGLAPGLRGANRTGRPFTGDFAGQLLYETLIACGFAAGTYGARPDDGLTLTRAMITNAVRCVPPENKPTGAEIAACRSFLAETLQCLAARNQETRNQETRNQETRSQETRSQETRSHSAQGQANPLAILALGRIAHDSVVRALGRTPSRLPFGHGAEHDVATPTGVARLFDSYHCSRYNTNTGVLTAAMFRQVLARVRSYVDGSG